MPNVERVIVIVLDGVGIGEAPDAQEYGDEGSHTLGNTARAVGGLRVPNMQRLGLGNITPLHGVAPASSPTGMFGKMQERSPGKDTTTGHWEIAGIVLNQPFPTYPNGFPPDLIAQFEQRIKREVIGNKAASGTAIIEEYAEEHLATGNVIVYTSADSVFQIAAHERCIPLDELYEICQIARDILQDDHAVGRVIARPFIGEPGALQRTAGRRDFSLPPPGETVLDAVVASGRRVTAIGKISDIFAGRGISQSLPTKNNSEGIAATLDVIQNQTESGLIFTNLVETDMIFGHRNDPHGFAEAVQKFDAVVPDILQRMNDKDLLIITADHGVDPTTPSTDHSREFVPLLVAGEVSTPGTNLGIRKTFADVAASVRHVFDLPPGRFGTSFL